MHPLYIFVHLGRTPTCGGKQNLSSCRLRSGRKLKLSEEVDVLDRHSFGMLQQEMFRPNTPKFLSLSNHNGHFMRTPSK
jgi:hypothetical protein